MHSAHLAIFAFFAGTARRPVTNAPLCAAFPRRPNCLLVVCIVAVVFFGWFEFPEDIPIYQKIKINTNISVRLIITN